MTKYLALLVVATSGIACGGTTETASNITTTDGGAGKGSSGSPSGGTASGGNGAGGAHSGGVSSGGASQAGASQGGASQAGASQGGASQGGASQGGASQGGVSQGGVSQGGVSQGGSGGSADPRCPPKTPTGACSDPDLQCEYNPATECLCFTSSTVLAYCEQVDPTCTATAPPPSSSGGVSTKIAVPAHQRCSCSAGAWSCALGI
jgi:hypothetical protein